MDSSQRVRAIVSFIQAVDAGSFAAAGRVLGLTSAAISKNVASLEKSLGVRLMNRTTRSLTLTSEGEGFLRQARIALEALDSAVDMIAARRAVPSGKVRISTSAAFGNDHLLPALPALLARYPALSIEVDFDDRIVDIVKEGYDIVIRGGSIADSALVSRPVCKLNAVLIASPEYLEAHGTPKKPSDLNNHRLIARRFLGGRVSPWIFKAADGALTTLDPTDVAVLTLSGPEALVQAARDHVGIAQVGVHLAWEHLRNGSLKVLLHEQHQPGSYEMVMQYPHRALMAPRGQVTVDHLLAAFSGDENLHVTIESLGAYAV
ncbi:LysR family transcriptional regulator [Pseudomonas sp. B2M1-30]|uniref:LysR family transcriptional regulator n=1 Tax=Pseudomonas koreensis TaxID=198620 RepID=A0A9X3B1G9_9PSED|nr:MULTISPECIES: LysR family transcriptional regulator [Pseudomonas]MCU0117438.1 LysR family transcriptional regulator [Pseudomonas sp. B2M1-30]MCU7246901.1 LysR family transcriptional regulator [Pseudomonas koreensis]MCU7258974.1 LysR family transcriptional regulator [Pseudomonas koreensis]